MSIKIITKNSGVVHWLTDHEGNWIEGPGLFCIRKWAFKDLLVDKFGNKYDFDRRDSNGDPRAFLGKSNNMSLAMMWGMSGEEEVGVMVEIESMYVLDSYVHANLYTKNGERVTFCSTATFEKEVEDFRRRLATIVDDFPFTRCTLAYGDKVTCTAGLNVLAFTPLLGQMDMCYSSPYWDKEIFEKLEDKIYKIFEDKQMSLFHKRLNMVND